MNRAWAGLIWQWRCLPCQLALRRPRIMIPDFPQPAARRLDLLAALNWDPVGFLLRKKSPGGLGVMPDTKIGIWELPLSESTSQAS